MTSFSDGFLDAPLIIDRISKLINQNFKRDLSDLNSHALKDIGYSEEGLKAKSTASNFIFLR